MRLKRFGQSRIREFHLTFMNRGLPDRVALYLHSLEESEYLPFADMVKDFVDRGYAPLTADSYGHFSGRGFFVSFDDNYRSWWKALPLLDDLSLKVTFYVNSMPIRGFATREQIEDYFDRIRHEGERETLSVEELREISRAGHVIGSHSRSHFLLTSLTRGLAERDIRLGKIELETILGCAVEHFSYPYGMRRHFNERLRRYCQEIGFKTVANAIPALQHEPFDYYRIQRSLWCLDRSLQYNLENLFVDGRWFHRITGRSAVG